MADAEHEDHDFRINHLIDHPIVADANAHLPGTSFELFAARRARIGRQQVDGSENALCRASIELPQGFERGTRIGNLVLQLSAYRPNSAMTSACDTRGPDSPRASAADRMSA